MTCTVSTPSQVQSCPGNHSLLGMNFSHNPIHPFTGSISVTWKMHRILGTQLHTISCGPLTPETGSHSPAVPRAQGLGESRSVSCLQTPSSLLNAHSLWDQPADTAVGAETAGTTGAGRHHSLSDCSPRPARALGLALTGDAAALCVCPCLSRDGHRTRGCLGTSVLLGLLVSDRLSPPSPGPQEPGSLWTIPELQRGKGHHRL